MANMASAIRASVIQQYPVRLVFWKPAWLQNSLVNSESGRSLSLALRYHTVFDSNPA